MARNFIVIDTETTGLKPGIAEITEIGAIKVDGNTFEVLDTYETLIDIDGFVPSFITSLTGITKSMLKEQGIRLLSALDQLVAFCGSLDVYAHNASFDKRFIRFFLEREGVTYIETEWKDTVKIFRKHLPGNSNYKLETLIKNYGLATKEDHRAVSDAMHTLALMKIVASK